MKPLYDMTMNELANHFMGVKMDDWQAAQHADNLLMQKQVLDALQMLYISSRHPEAYEACLTVAAALGLAKDFAWMNEPKVS
jgi:L-cysteine desulfidase